MRKELLIGLLLTAMSAGAVKMKPGVATIKQSDGTTLTSERMATKTSVILLRQTALYFIK